MDMHVYHHFRPIIAKYIHGKVVRSDLAEKIIQTCNFQTAIAKKCPPLQMSTQASLKPIPHINQI